MVTLSHRMRVIVYATLLAFLMLMLFTRQTHADWTSEPVEFHSTTARIPRVALCPDGQAGVLVFWQEGVEGPLLATRLLGTGVRDPAWPAGGLVVLPGGAALRSLGAVTDGDCGGYVWWFGVTDLMITRVTRAGEVAAQWPALGRSLGMLAEGDRPWIEPDGAGGVYVGWWELYDEVHQTPGVSAIHLGPDGRGAAGWPDHKLRFGGPAEPYDNFAPAFSLDAAGGLWVAWLWVDLPRPDGTQPAAYRVSRVDPAGKPRPGWTTAGVDLVPVIGDVTTDFYGAPMRPVAIADDGREGFYLLTWDHALSLMGSRKYGARARRFDASRSAIVGWSESGRPVDQYFAASTGASFSPRIVPTVDGRLLTTGVWFASEDGSSVEVERRSSEYAFQSKLLHLDHPYSRKTRLLPTGEIASAYCQTWGWTRDWLGTRRAAVLGLYAAPGVPVVSHNMIQTELHTTWYGDADIEITGDRSAILVWSQERERHGLQAVRLSAGRPLAVDASPPLLAPRVWYLRGEGVRVAGVVGRVTLHDLSGRELARGEAESAGEWTVPGTAELPSGMYFARTRLDAAERNHKVVVIR